MIHCCGVGEKNMKKFYALFFVFVSLFAAIVVPSYAASDSITWTEAELAFREDHPVIRLGVNPGFVPFEFIDDDGEYKGITADYLALISEKTGLQFEVVQGLTWPEA